MIWIKPILSENMDQLRILTIFCLQEVLYDLVKKIKNVRKVVVNLQNLIEILRNLDQKDIRKGMTFFGEQLKIVACLSMQCIPTW